MAIQRLVRSFDYKLRWFERLIAYAAELLASGSPVVLAGDYNVMPTEIDVYNPERWLDDALFRPEVREAYRHLVAQGRTDALRSLHPGERIYNVLGLFPECVCSERRLAHRPSVAQSVGNEPPLRCGSRPRRAWLGQGQRSCADLD